MNLIRLNTTAENFALTLTPGGDLVGPVNAMMVPSNGEGETIEQVIDVQLGNTAGDCETGINWIGRFLWLAETEAAKPGGALVYLECQVLSTDEIYRSPVLSGWFEPGPGGVDQRATGSMGGKLHLVRANWWETVDETAIIEGQAVSNHRDSGHNNSYYDVTLGGPHEELPAQVRIAAALTTAVTAPAALFIGMRAGSPGVLDLFYEGQDGAARAGVTPSTVVDAASSDGSYNNLAWNGSTETRLWQVDITAAKMAQAGGKPFRVLMRLGDGYPTTATERLWYKWEIAYVDEGGAEQFLYESPGAYLPTLQELILGPVLYLPPWVPTGTSPQLRVVLKATAAGAGAHALKLDWIDFCPLDGWRYYDPILQSYGLSINDTGAGGVTGPAGGVMTHAMEGPGFLMPQRKAMQVQLYWMVKEAAEVSAAATLAGTVSIYYRTRRKML